MNITREEARALRDLRKNKDIMILKANKGNATVILDSNEYDNKMLEHLTTSGCYKKLKKDPSNKIIKEISEAIKQSTLDDNIKKKITPKNPLIPCIYGLPKIHKQGYPLRPIVNTIGVPSYGLAKILAEKLKPLTGHSPSFVKDSSSFVDDIKTIRLEENDLLVSFDIVALYTNIPVDEAIDVIRNLTNRETADLVKLCLKFTYFSFRGEIYEQTNGMAMGSPLSPVVANIYMEFFEEKAINSSPLKPKH